jgi:hypothetical protein
MRDPRRVMRIRVPAVAFACAVFIALSSTPASAAVKSAGPCHYGGKWILTVDQYDATHLRVTFVIRSGDPGSVWQLFGSDNDHPLATKTHTADQYGVVRVRWRPLDRAGSDSIVTTGTATTGNVNSCAGSVTFP